MAVAWGRAAALCAAIVWLGASGAALAQPNCTQFNGTTFSVTPPGVQKDFTVVLRRGDRIRLVLSGANGEMFVNGVAAGSSFTATTDGTYVVGASTEPSNPPAPGTATFECTPAPTTPPNPNPPNPPPMPGPDMRAETWGSALNDAHRLGIFTVVEDQSAAVNQNAESALNATSSDPAAIARRMLEQELAEAELREKQLNARLLALYELVRETDRTADDLETLIEVTQGIQKSREEGTFKPGPKFSELEFFGLLVAIPGLQAQAKKARADAAATVELNKAIEAERSRLWERIRELKKALGGPAISFPFAAEERAHRADPLSPSRRVNSAGSPWTDPAFGGGALGYAGLPVKAPAASGPVAFRSRVVEGWSVWGQGRYTSFQRSGAASTDGHFATFTGGVNYRVLERWLVGLALGYEDQKFDTTFNGGYFRGSGPTVGPYVSYLLSPNLIATVWMGTAFLSYSVSDGVGTGGYDARRYFVSGSLIGTWNYGAWRFSPRASAFYATEKRDGFTDNLGLVMPGATINAGRVQVGPEVGYRFIAFDGRGFIEPFGFVALDCHFAGTSTFVVAAGIVVTDNRCGGRAGGGIKVGQRNGVSGSIGAAYNSIGRAGQNSWTASASVSVPFMYGLR